MRPMDQFHIRVTFPCDSGTPEVAFYDISARNVTLAMNTARSLAATRLRVTVTDVTKAPENQRKHKRLPYRIACFGGGFTRELAYRRTLKGARDFGSGKITNVLHGTRHRTAEVSQWNENTQSYVVVETLRNE